MGETKYIFITDGAASSLGKGVILSSVGKLLQARDYNVTIQKLGPYVNIGPGALNPYKHRGCYVTVNGHEAGLDLGHYERFLGIQTTRANNTTTGRTYEGVIGKERHGDYLGKTVQAIPHITDKIKRDVKLLDNKYKSDFIITEIGGMAGDIESPPYLESIRQLEWGLGKNIPCVHLTYVPYLATAGELKARPTRHSVKELQNTGIQPDVLVLRIGHPLSDGLRKRIAQSCDADDKTVVQSIDVGTIYEVPILMQAQGLDSAILERTGLPVEEAPRLDSWHKFLERCHAAEAKEPINTALVGKYDLQDAYKSVREALPQAGTYDDRRVKIHFVNSEKLTDENVCEALKDMADAMIGPGFGQRDIDGRFVAIKYTRTHDIPAFGICLGIRCITIEFTRNILGYTDTSSRETDEKVPHSVIDIVEEQKVITNTGGMIRLGAYKCVLQKGLKAYQAYGQEHTQERHRHHYEFNNDYKERHEATGMKYVGINPESDLVEIAEIPTLKWLIGTQFHPGYGNTVLNSHPLFVTFVKAAIESEKATVNG